ncbi:MAG: hypothetical protein JXB34_12060 [Bacteroidales bacterium]|nr:hypothetical protein [Bacteroidales bacterium]
MEIIYFLAGLVFGGGAVWLIFRSRGTAHIESLNRVNSLFELENKELKLAVEEKNREILGLNNSLTTSQSDLNNLNLRLKEQKEELSAIREKFNLEFRNLANDIFEEKSKRFTEQNKLNLSEILKPLGEK